MINILPYLEKIAPWYIIISLYLYYKVDDTYCKEIDNFARGETLKKQWYLNEYWMIVFSVIHYMFLICFISLTNFFEFREINSFDDAIEFIFTLLGTLLQFAFLGCSFSIPMIMSKYRALYELTKEQNKQKEEAAKKKLSA